MRRNQNIAEQIAPFLVIFSVTFALLINEILLSSIFHVLIGGGNTITAIAIALLGLSSAGVIAYIAPVFSDPERYRSISVALLLLFGIALTGSTLLLMNIPVNHAELAFAHNNINLKLTKLGIYFIATIPFFLGGLVVTLVLRNNSARISRLYASDLTGAALGCIASPVLLTTVGAPLGILYSAIPSIVIGSCAASRRNVMFKSLSAFAILLLAFGIMNTDMFRFQRLNTMGEVHNPAHQSFMIGKDDIEYEKWALDAWTIIRSPDIAQQWENFRGWGVTDAFTGDVPRIKQINYNARFSTYVTDYDGDITKLSEWLDSDLISQHYLLGREPESVLIIGAGGGREVLNAINHGASKIVAVDISDVVIEDIMKDYLREYSGDLYFDPRVTAVADEGRSYVERSADIYDLIDFSIVGGMNLEKMDLVRVEDLFTLEALRTYFNHLSDDGMFSYVMYTLRTDIVDELVKQDYLTALPYIPALKTLSGLRIIFEDAFPNATFSDHVLISVLHGRVNPNYDLAHIIVSKSPITRIERARYLDTAKEKGFVAIYPMQESTKKSAGLYPELVESVSLKKLSTSLPFSIAPSTDDIPFNFAFDLQHIRNAMDHGALLDFLAVNPVISLAINMTILVALLILLPLTVSIFREGGTLHLRRAWPLLILFACLGFGYMVVEIAVLLKLQIYLGKPVYGLSVGLFSFLFSSGLGANFTNRFNKASMERTIYTAVVCLIIIGLVYYGCASDLFLNTIHLSLLERILIAVASIFPMAFIMGMFFPMGIKLISGENPNLIPWVWAINGSFSVLGIFGTRIAALFIGFGQSILMGLALYVVVMMCAYAYFRIRGKVPLAV